jgi:hypothetical protein
MIDLSIIVSPLPFVAEVDVGTFSNGENCTMSGKFAAEVRGFVTEVVGGLVSGLFWWFVLFGIG